MSAGEVAIWSAYAARSSETGRKPQDTPTDSMQALRAVSMSTAESPAYNTSRFGVGCSLSAANTIDGSGFVERPGISPSAATNGISGKQWFMIFVTAA